MRIDRCICFAVRFETLAALADETGAESVSQLQCHRAFGLRCGLCRPYVRRMLRTGQTTFERVVTEAEEPERTLQSFAE